MARLSIKEAAAYVPIARGTLDKLRIYGGGPRYIKLGKKVLYDRADLDAWIEEHKRTTTDQTPPRLPRQPRKTKQGG
jgi:excisionase family DNA binding protein